MTQPSENGIHKTLINIWQEESGGWLKAAVERDPGHGRAGADSRYAAGRLAAGTAAAVQWVEQRYGPEAADEIATHINETMITAMKGPLDWARLNRRLRPPQS
ncbi:MULTISPECIES: hypothetical protein [Streptomyces]|uniref:Uncharacterized protein n=2 Tax=Streptomyces rimosus subsp. rimosus TaxID=132474 RepID=L8EVH4_STRR1|nr:MULTISPECIES: hypothetical protein [Streptomyces]KOG84171.1 hypothetical protein ADK78_00840 [Kitasatospora aureofaciens]MYT44910.1 hypothetical protein [Streptomyces sp. SID5471]KOT27942.1 hypothetical protein ADK84_37255 [Streptomyces sp. NRRL WC-3701]KOT42240.1 hypothetical protein ADK42_10020 [Streptomyces rimosus subsp. rimosus]KOT68538.1 hypothetical protein ADK44_00685 [Streptomyces rimosus subsp. rimosus]